MIKYHYKILVFKDRDFIFSTIYFVLLEKRYVLLKKYVRISRKAVFLITNYAVTYQF